MASKLIASELAKIERLNGVNYDMWSRKIRYGLIHDNVDFVIDGVAPTLGQTPTDTQKREYEQWKTYDKKAKSLMLMFMEDNLIKVFEVYNTAKELWDALKEKYDHTSEVNVQLMLHNYNSCQMKENENVIDHCNHMIVMAKDLAAAGNELSENMQIATILNSLPPSLDMVATTLRHNGKIKKVTDLPAALAMEQDLANRRKKTELNLAQEEELNVAQAHYRHKNQNKRQNQFNLGPSKGKFKGKPNQNQKRVPQGACYTCGRFGHFKANCPQKQQGNKGEVKHPERGGPNKREFVGVIECNAGHVATDIDGWWIDSGATRHIAKTKKDLTEFKELKKGEQRIFMANNTYLDVVGIGTYKLDLGDSVMVLKNVMYAPGMRRNLVSVPALLQHGLEVRFYNNRVSIGKDKKVFAMGKFEPDHELFKLPVVTNDNMNKIDSSGYSLSYNICTYDLWHYRLGHPGKSKMEQIIKNNLLPLLKDVNMSPCEHCLKGKMTRKPFKEGQRSNELLGLIHSDICGPLNVKTHGNKEYFITFIDDYSKFSQVYLISRKSEAFECFKNYKTKVEKQLGRDIKVLRTDRGGEYNSTEFDNYCQEQGIIRHKTMSYTPQQNGVAERKNRTLLNVVRCLLSHSRLSKIFWGEALLTANYILNRIPTKCVESTP